MVQKVIQTSLDGEPSEQPTRKQGKWRALIETRERAFSKV